MTRLPFFRSGGFQPPFVSARRLEVYASAQLVAQYTNLLSTCAMPAESLMRCPDLLVIGVNLGRIIAIGIYCARRTCSADAYFLADRKMPGRVVGLSLMATLISSMTFLVSPATTYAQD